MWKNNLLTSLRSFQRDSFYVFVNILSIALAFSICTIGYFNYRFNETYNSYFEDLGRIYKLDASRTAHKPLSKAPSILAEQIRSNHQNVKVGRYTSNRLTVKLGEERFHDRIAFTDKEFISILPFQNMEGNAVEYPRLGEVVISEKTADRYFGHRNVKGEMIRLVLPDFSEKTMIVSDILADIPFNMSFQFDVLISMDHYFDFYRLPEKSWKTWIGGIFLLIPHSIQLEEFQSQIQPYAELQNKHNPELEIESYQLANLIDWPGMAYDRPDNIFNGHLHPASVVGTWSSAVAIMILACFTFINTSISIAGKRLKEIGMRKVFGAGKRAIITQFMVENAIIILISLLISLGVSYFLIPAYNGLFDFNLIELEHIPLSTILTFAGGLLVVVTLLAGAYPSFVLSRFPSLTIFQKKAVLSRSNGFTKGMLVLQFAVCFYSIFGLLIFVDNSIYQENLDRGYRVNEVINVPLNDPAQYDILEAQLKSNPNIQSLSPSRDLVGFHYGDGQLEFDGLKIAVADFQVGKEYLKTLKVQLEEGSHFQATEGGESNEIIINQMLAEHLSSPLNTVITYLGKKYRIIGITNNFNLDPIMLDYKIKPAIMRLARPEEFKYAVISVEAGELYTSNQMLEVTWYELFPNERYSGFLQERVTRHVDKTNYICIRINGFTALVSLLISSLGLYTLIALIVQKRTKEFGVRKVLGASILSIIDQLGRSVYWVLGLAGLIGLVSGYYVMGMLLDIIFAYHLDVSLIHVVISIGIIAVIVVISLIYQVLKAARLNPVVQLRTE